MLVLVCGSRDWQDIHAIRKRLVKLPPDTEIIHGGARGADSTAGMLADDLGFSVRVFYPNWNVHGEGATFARNIKMLEERPDLVIAFQVGGSRGTQHTIDEAFKRRIPVEVYREVRRESKLNGETIHTVVRSI